MGKRPLLLVGIGTILTTALLSSAAAQWPTNSGANRVFIRDVIRGRDRSSPLLANAVQRALFTTASQNSIDPRLVMAIAGAESQFASDGSRCVTRRRNAYGWGGGWPSDAVCLANPPPPVGTCCFSYGNFADSTTAVTAGLRRLYVSPGYRLEEFVTPPGPGAYCVGSRCADWARTVGYFLGAMGANGDPDNREFSFGGDCCFGDCDYDGQVAVNELVAMVNIALGQTGPHACWNGINSDTRTVTIVEIIRAILVALNSHPGCLFTAPP